MRKRSGQGFSQDNDTLWLNENCRGHNSTRRVRTKRAISNYTARFFPRVQREFQNMLRLSLHAFQHWQRSRWPHVPYQHACTRQARPELPSPKFLGIASIALQRLPHVRYNRHLLVRGIGRPSRLHCPPKMTPYNRCIQRLRSVPQVVV